MYGGGKLSNAVTARIVGPAVLCVADARANEAEDGVAFQVSLSQVAPGTVAVDYATVDGTAVAGEDYSETSVTLTFAAGELEKSGTRGARER